MVKVVVFEAEGTGSWLFSDNPTVQSVIESLQAILEKVPEKYRDDTTCEIEVHSSYPDSFYPSITVSYERPETEDESAERLESNRDRRLAHEAQEKSMLRALQAKYPGFP